MRKKHYSCIRSLEASSERDRIERAAETEMLCHPSRWSFKGNFNASGHGKLLLYFFFLMSLFCV